MTEFIQRNPQDNPRLNQIYQILLVAGYFRIRIASLKAFDKIVGGIAWCITSSNFEIEVEYNDQMQIGQKIRVSEVICASLVRMKCPYTLQPYQLQGLDVNNIFPIVQWLVKFVYQTRFQRQKYDRQLSIILGKPITQLQSKGNPQKLPQQTNPRTRINRVIQKTSHKNPIRVYSALLEHNDATAAKMYNKLLNIMNSKKNKGKGVDGRGDGRGDGKGGGDSLAEMLVEENQEVGAVEESNLNQFSQFSTKLSLDKLQRVIQQNKNALQQGIQQHQTEQFLFQPPKPQPQSQSPQFPKQPTITEQQKHLKQAKTQNKKYQQKIQILKNQLASFEAICGQLDHQLSEIQAKHEEAEQMAARELGKNEEYREAEREIAEQLRVNKGRISGKLEQLVERRQGIKNRKVEVKKKAKAKIDQLNYEVQVVQASVPQIDQQAFKTMLKQAQTKKQIYTKKYQQLTLINQQLAILQRKSQNYTSPPQIAQYHQRFIQLFESINVLIQQKRSMFSQLTNLQSLKKVVQNFHQIMTNMKTGYQGVRKRGELRQFNEDIKEILQGLEANMRSSQAMVGKVRGKREAVYGEYMELIRGEREYLHLLRELKIQYENAARFYK